MDKKAFLRQAFAGIKDKFGVEPKELNIGFLMKMASVFGEDVVLITLQNLERMEKHFKNPLPFLYGCCRNEFNRITRSKLQREFGKGRK